MLCMARTSTAGAQEPLPTPLPEAPAPLGLNTIIDSRFSADEIEYLFSHLPTTIGSHTQYLSPPVFRLKNPRTIQVEYREGGPDGAILRLSAIDVTDLAFIGPCRDAAECVAVQA